MSARREDRRVRTMGTLVLIVGGLLAVLTSIGLVSPRSRPAPESPSVPAFVAEHEPSPPQLVVPRSPRMDDIASPARAPIARESAWKAEDAESEPRARGSASINHRPDRVRLDVRVTRSGLPEPTASVELLHEPRDPTLGSSPTPRVYACDGEGVLSLELAPGTVRAVAWSAEACALPASLELELAEPARLELPLEASYPLAGRVVDARNGAPIAGATVALWTYAERDTVTTGPDGSFLHPRFPARAPAQQIAARAEGFGLGVRYLRIADDGAWRLSAVSAGESSVKGTGTPWVELELVPELRVRGRLVDRNGDPVAAARVSAEGFFHAMPSVASRDQATTVSDAQGVFELFALRSDVGHSLLVAAPGFAHELCELEGDVLEHDLGTLALAPETVLAGVVIDGNGVPLAGVEVVLRCTGPYPQVQPRGALDVPARIQGRELRLTTTLEGTFLFEHLAARPVTLALERPDGSVAELELQPLPDGSFESPCVTLLPAAFALAENER